ncbi:MAG: phage holin family protein [Coriobacteriales bacterium]|jgi:putative membrane protein
MKLFARWLAIAIAIVIAVWLLPGIDIAGTGWQPWIGVGIFAAVLGVVNIFVKPLVKLLTLPITIITLGLFYLVINTAMLYLAAYISNEFFSAGISIASFWSGLCASIVISIVSGIVNGITGAKS